MEVLHAVFHRALVRPGLVVAALHQRLAPGVHAQRDLVILDTGLHVGGLLSRDEFALEGGDLLGVVELHHVDRFLRPFGVERRYHQHMRIPLDHDVRVVSQPDRALFGWRAIAQRQHRLMPALVGR